RAPICRDIRIFGIAGGGGAFRQSEFLSVPCTVFVVRGSLARGRRSPALDDSGSAYRAAGAGVPQPAGGVVDRHHGPSSVWDLRHLLYRPANGRCSGSAYLAAALDPAIQPGDFGRNRPDSDVVAAVDAYPAF